MGDRQGIRNMEKKLRVYQDKTSLTTTPR
ncbi:uncharacterized protein G2W53_022624 [Senna tora]|uniref:Uncharacterized protein n=1 Tax=Senna tora TaxID=362788 RepID=A0A834WID2_9FABA|nr:uncharacterized protein G2W53_022624 [Senna tora]